MIAELRKLWQEAFDDPEAALDNFFATGYSQNRFHCILENNIPVSALYWFDCECAGEKLAYIYAVATLKTHRGKGLAHRLMAQTHEILKNQGYAGAILVPGETRLFDFYEKTGYRPVTSVTEFVCQPTGPALALREVDGAEYARLRKALLPPGGVVQEGATIDYLQTYCKFYVGEDFLLCATAEKQTLLVHELLGNPALAPQILTALGMEKGQFRTPGTGRDFAMYLPFTAHCPIPGYFGLALD